MISMSQRTAEKRVHAAGVGFMAEVRTCCQYRENLPTSLAPERSQNRGHERNVTGSGAAVPVSTA